MHLQCFTPTRTYMRDDHYPICTKLHYGIVWPYYVCYVEFSGHFFFFLLSVYSSLEEKNFDIDGMHLMTLYTNLKGLLVVRFLIN